MKKLEEQELSTAEDVVEIDEEILQQKDDSEKVLQETIKKIKETASEKTRVLPSRSISALFLVAIS